MARLIEEQGQGACSGHGLQAGSARGSSGDLKIPFEPHQHGGSLARKTGCEVRVGGEWRDAHSFRRRNSAPSGVRNCLFFCYGSMTTVQL